MLSREEILQLLAAIPDPEVPVLSILDLGIVRSVQVKNGAVEIEITPTYSGCPAMNTIATQIRMELLSRNLAVTIREVLRPAWTTDWMSDSGKAKLKAYGIAPPQYSSDKDPGERSIVPCPICNSPHTRLVSWFGSTSCKALYQCNDCKEPFDYFKCH
ncbi:MAG TPA: phenylacetate-CoA oxygenase subunit PaaJ [Chitinophagaceae bacterium]|nr:phenylacetate-CoA oxygenase subunit PaaJ [Chitinophagaceae bacterium]HNF71627.1 phenylacetate-CoA oxygenase subunit PaaJ [Chitinophagaceae bacterium]